MDTETMNSRPISEAQAKRAADKYNARAAKHSVESKLGTGIRYIAEFYEPYQRWSIVKLDGDRFMSRRF